MTSGQQPNLDNDLDLYLNLDLAVPVAIVPLGQQPNLELSHPHPYMKGTLIVSLHP